MKILITGGCGLLARTLTKELEGSHEITLLDRNKPEEASAFQIGFAPFKTEHLFIQAQITDHEAMLKAMKGMDAVVNLAASVTGLPEFGVETFRDNALGTFVVLDAARLSGVKRVLCASSINAFGTIYWRISGKPVEYKTMPLTEDFPVVVEDPYSLSKYVNEVTCDAFTRAYGMTTAAFRFAGIIRDEQYQSMGDPGLPLTTAWSDDVFQWVHINDVATGLRQAVECPTLPDHGVYTLGAADTRCPEPTMEILNKFRPDLAANLTEPLPGRAPLMSITKAKNAFGYNPRYHLADL